MKKRGCFITVEGLDGSGKSTQIDLIKEYLEECGRQVIISVEPGGTPIADRIRDLLLDPECKNMDMRTELFLYLASRAQHTSEVIIPAIWKGLDVICSRYYDATIAYQGYARGMDIDFIRHANDFAIRDVHPDLTIIIDIDPLKGISQAHTTKKKHNISGKGDRMEQQSQDFYQLVRKGYQAIARQETERVQLVPFCDGVENLFREIQKVLDTFFEKKGL